MDAVVIMAPSRRDTQLTAAAYVLIHSIIKNKSKHDNKRHWWVRKIYRNRSEYGNRLLEDLRFEEDVRNFTRMSTTDFEYLLHLIEPTVAKNDTYMRDAITVKERLLIKLRFFATGDSFTSLQYLFRVSKQAISQIVPEVCDALIEALKDYIKLPSSEVEWLAIAESFEKKWNFPHALGAMDGKHVMIQAPFYSGSEFYNYKNFFSIVLLALIDANYNFLYVNVGSPGRISDGGVFKNTQLYRKLENKELNVPEPKAIQIPYAIEVPYMILADQAFELTNYTIKPFSPGNEAKIKIINMKVLKFGENVYTDLLLNVLKVLNN